MHPNQRVAILGAGPLAYVVAACVAQVYRVHAIAPEPSQSFALSEPLLLPRLNYARSIGHLAFDEPIATPDVLWLCPELILVQDGKPDLVTLSDALAELIGHYGGPETLVILSADVPPGFTKLLKDTARHARIAYVAELLQRGRAVEGFERPDRIIVGYDFDPKTSLALKSFFSPWTAHLIETGLREAEVAKLAVNAYLAALGALTNEIADWCGTHSIDPREVEAAVRTDHRFGYQLPLTAGPALRSEQMLRDVRYLRDRIAEASAPILHAIDRSNRARLPVD